MAETTASDGPYVGPRPFEADERERFFGRDQEAGSLASLVVAHRVVLLYAASGAGKTSLLSAGLAPQLERDDGFEVLPAVRLRGLASPDAAANPYIANATSSLARELGVALVDGERASPHTLADVLAACSRPDMQDESLPVPRALIFDQFEELFTLYPERWQQRHEVFEQIAEALDQDPLLRVVLAIREDYIAQLDPYAALLPDRLRTRMRLESLRRQQALAAVTGPLEPGRRRFAAGVAEQLVDDLLKVRVHTLGDQSTEAPGEFVEPVQLQVVCRTLWFSLPENVDEIDVDDLARVGSVSDVLAEYYEQAVRAAALAGGLSELDLRDRLEAAMITPVGTRGTVVGGTDSTAGIPNAAIAELEARRLVRAEWRAGARWFELAHDSLIRPIVTTNATLRGARQAKRERVLKQAVASLMVVAVLLAGLLWAGGGGDRQSRRLGLIEGGGPLAGLRLVRTFGPSASPVALQPVAGGRALLVGGSDGRIRIWDVNAGTEITTLDYGDSGLSAAALRPDGRELLTAGRIGVRRWRTAGVGTSLPKDVRFRILDHRPAAVDRTPITSVSFDPTGQSVIVVDDGRASLREGVAAQVAQDLRSGQPFASRAVVRAAYSPTGSAVLGVTANGSARVRDVVLTGFEERSVGGRERVLRRGGSIVSAAFSPDGRTIVTASSDGSARLWRTRDGRLLRELSGDGASLSDARFSPNGRLVATAARNGLVGVWTLEGDRVAVLRASRGPLSAVAFAAEGRMLVTAGADSAVRVWAAPAARNPVAARLCSSASYYAQPSGSIAASAARGSDGRRYRATIECAVAAGTAVLAPERGILTSSRGTDAQPRVMLTTDTGRRWVFFGTVSRGGPPEGSRVAGGARIGSVGGVDPRQLEGIRVELWARSTGGHRLANLWNPLLFLALRSTELGLAYPGDRASKARLAQWMGSGAVAMGLPPELPVMAALVESGLRNNPVARDVAGFFSMRLGIWNAGAYQGYATRPALQLKWFLDHAREVRPGRIARGFGDPAADAANYGAWVADVERPALRYRGRYGRQLATARALLGPVAKLSAFAR